MKIEVLNPALLKTLYYLLIELSSHPQCTAKKGAALIDLDIKHSFCGIRVKFKDVRMLSDVLFRALPESFSQLLSTLHDLFRKSDSGEAGMHLDMWAMIEKMNLLLRCCMLALNMVDCQEYLLEKGRILIAILRKLNSLNLVGSGEESVICFEKSVSREHIYGNDWIATYTEDFVASLHFIQPFDPYLPFLSSVLEVFADELLVHRQIREYFKLIDSVSSGSEKPFICYAGYDNIGIVIEVISSHFVISYSDGQAYERLLNRLLFVDGKEFRAPELSPPAAASLFLNPVMLSAPKFYQAHLILLVSEATCTCMGLEISKPDPRLLDCYLSLLESSIILYGNHMSTCQLDYISTDSGISFVKSHISGGHLPSSFESCVQPVTRKNIDRLISNFDNSWHLHLRIIKPTKMEKPQNQTKLILRKPKSKSSLDILKESLKTIIRNGKPLLSITLMVFLSLSSLSISRHLLLAPLLRDLSTKAAIVHDQLNSREIGRDRTVGRMMVKEFRIFIAIRSGFLLLALAILLFFTVAIIDSSYEAYTAKKLTVRDMILRIRNKWKKPIFTNFYMILFKLSVGFLILALIMIIFFTTDGYFMSLLVLGALVLGAVCYLYLSALWMLSIVVSVVETDIGGLKTVSRGGDLMRGKRIQGCVLMLICVFAAATVYWMASVLGKNTETSGWTRLFLIRVLKIWALCMAKLFMLVVFTVFYHECERSHGKSGVEEETYTYFSLTSAEP